MGAVQATAAGLVDEREAEALEVAAEEAVRRYRAGQTTSTSLGAASGGGLISSLRGDDVLGDGERAWREKTGSKATTTTTTMTTTSSGNQLRGGTSTFDAAQVRVTPRVVTPAHKNHVPHRMKWAVLETSTPCELKRYPGVRQFLDHRAHLYRHRMQVEWGGGDPRMVLADDDKFVGIVPLGRMRKMEEIEELLREFGIVPDVRGGADGEL